MLICASCGAELENFANITEDTRYVACEQCMNVLQVSSENGIASAKPIAGFPAVADIAEEGSVTEGILKLARDAIVELPAFPDVPLEVIRLAHDPITSMDDLGRVISDDASLSLRVLKMANSAWLSANSEVTELNQACARLGMKVITQMAHIFCAQEAFERLSKKLPDHVQQLWAHGVISGRCSAEIASACDVEEVAPTYLAGLVHDAGKLVFLDAAFNRYGGRLGRLADEPEILNKVLAKFAPLIGAHVVQHWHLPDAVLAATYFIDNPEALAEPKWRPFVYSVALGSDMAAAMGYEVGTGTPSDEIPPALIARAQQAGFNEASIRSVYQTVSESASDYAHALELG